MDITAAVLLGAGKFPDTPSFSNPSFKSSKDDFEDYLRRNPPQGLGLSSAVVLDLFNAQLAPGQQLRQIGEFLDELKKAYPDAVRNLILYYVGHGYQAGAGGREYFLALAQTDLGVKETTGLPFAALSGVLKQRAKSFRFFCILDCCFAGEALRAYQGDTDVVGRLLTAPLQADGPSWTADLPRRGAAALCAASPDEAAQAPENLRRTVFTDALLEVLSRGDRELRDAMTLADVCDLAWEYIREKHAQVPQNQIRPYLGSPDQTEGDIARKVLLFPNPSSDARPSAAGQPGAQERPAADQDRQAAAARQAERQAAAARQAEQEAAARQAEQEQREAAARCAQQERQAAAARQSDEERQAGAALQRQHQSQPVTGSRASGKLGALGGALVGACAAGVVAWLLLIRSPTPAPIHASVTASSDEAGSPSSAGVASSGARRAAVARPRRAAANVEEQPQRVASLLTSSSRLSSTGAQTRQLTDLQGFRDCEDGSCPWMVRIPPGHFQMGSPAGEAGHQGNEAPAHEVNIAYAFAVSQYPITRGQWGQYLQDSRRTGSTGCHGWSAATGKAGPPRWYSWQNPGFPQQDDHPVVCVSWHEARDYASWLSAKTGHHYRLLSEAEYEYINRAGSSSTYFWGDDLEDACRYANVADASAKSRFSGWTTTTCVDGDVFTSPVGRFQKNRFGLYDTTGNVWSWTEDCYHESYRSAPTDGSAWTAGDCSRRVIRGGAWNSLPGHFRAAIRTGSFATGASFNLGLRLAMTG